MAEAPKNPAPKDESLTSLTSLIAPSSQLGTSPKPGLNPNAPTFPSSILLAIATQAVLLQTAQTSIYDPKRPQDTLKVRLILDSRS